MENVFEEMLSGEEVQATDNTVDNDGDFDHSYDIGVEDLVDGNTESDTLEETTVVEESNTSDEDLNPTNHAFAQMRNENKQYSQQIAEIDNLVKSLGLKNINDFVEKAKDAQTKLEAKKTGIPVELAKEMAEIRALKNDLIAERDNNIQEAKERAFVSNVDSFIKDNKLSKATVDKLSQDLENDGISMESLMEMPKSAINRILGSYVGTDYQKSLERKETIKKEQPINHTSNTDVSTLNKEIDKLARQLAGK